MATDKDLYAVLGLSKGASADDIRKAYRTLARESHPDMNPDDAAAEERFKDVSYAYDVLGDDGKRALYDEFGTEGLQAGFDPQRAREYRRWAGTGHGFSFGSDGDGFDFGFDPRARSGGRRRGGNPFADIFGDMFGGGDDERRGPRDLEHPLEVGFLDAIRGTTLSVAIRRPVPCGECRGAGVKGRRGCPACGGGGRVERTEKLSVKIPPGVATGSKVLVGGKGEEAPGGNAGDLIFLVTVRSHPRLSREGQDVAMDVPITVPEAVAGGRITVPSPKGGKVQVTVPPGTQSGQRLRISGHGAPSLKGGAAGDLTIRLLVQVPTADGDGLDAALDALGRAYAGDVRAGLEL